MDGYMTRTVRCCNTFETQSVREGMLLKKITAALLAAALLFSLSSCGSWRPSDSDDAGSQQESTVPGSSTVPSENETPETEEKETMNNRPVVYMTTDISPQGLMAVYKLSLIHI